MTEAYLPCLAVASGTGAESRDTGDRRQLSYWRITVDDGHKEYPFTKTYLFTKNGYILLYVNVLFPQSWTVFKYIRKGE